MTANTYKSAGVDLALDDVCKGIFTAACRETFENSKLARVIDAADSELHRVLLIKIGKQYFMLNSDGIGTKIEIAERMNKHWTMAYDLVAMLADDAVRFGARPVAMVNDLNVAKLDRNIAKQLASGLKNAAEYAKIIVIGGEIAQLGGRVAGRIPEAYNWSGTLLSVIDPDEIITGEKIRKGDAIVALQEDSFRSNGLSLVRKIAREKVCEDWHNIAVNNTPLGDYVLRPSRIYSPAITAALDKGCKITGIAHITGGGIPGKLGRLLKQRELGAHLHSLWPASFAMSYFQKLGNVSDEEAYRTWNMGNGMLIVTRDPDKVIETATAKGESYAAICGEITKNPEIVIKTEKGNTINYEVK